MPNIEWNDISDWDSSQDNTGIDHNNDPYTTSDPGKLKQGYQKQWPPLTHGLVGWWPLSGHYKDLSGEGNHGTPNGGPTTGVAGRGGLQATSFDGTDDYINVGAVPSLQISGDVTVSAWVKNATTTGDVIGCGSADETQNTNYQYSIAIIDSSTIAFQQEYGSGSNANLEFSVNVTDDWTHILFTRNSQDKSVSLYINGVKHETKSYSNTIDGGSSSALQIGSDAPNNLFRPFGGVISDSRVYSRRLSDGEIQTLYKWGSADLASPPTDGVARYPMDGDATDSWGSNNGTSNGGLVYSSDAIRGQSGDFDGGDDNITVSDSGSLSPDHITVSAWMRIPSSETNTRPLFKAGSSAPYNFYVTSSGEFRWEIHNGSYNTVFSPSTINHGGWVHVTGTYNGSIMRLYINGTVVSELTGLTGTLTDTSGSLYIGSEDDGRYFGGLIEDVRIYDYALTPQEVFELYRYGTRGINMNKHTVMQ